jgi:hypothetical protein
MKVRTLSNIWLVAIHALLGFVLVWFPLVLTAWVIVFILYSLHRIFTTRNIDGYAAIAAAYAVGLEISCRMVKSHLPWEYTKYVTILFLVAAMFAERRKNPVPLFPIVYFIFLLPSILILELPNLAEYKDELSFNLSGPLCLAVSVLYFYRRQFSKEFFGRIFLALTLGIVSTMVIIVVRMPSIENIEFTHVANYMTSGGFGPNQVSTMLGAGFLIMSIAWFLKISITGNLLLDRWIGGASMVIAIFTFARGGVIVPPTCLFLGAILMALKSENPVQFVRSVWIISIVALFAGAGYMFVNNLTHDALADRYETAQKTADVPTEFDESLRVEGINLSGRESLFLADLIVFTKYPFLGVGPGGGQEARAKIGGVVLAAHTEQSRMLCEHGLYGLFALILLIASPIRAFASAPNLNTKLIILCLTLFCFLTMLHAAIRLALPAFIYGLGFAYIVPALSNPLMTARKPNQFPIS